MVLWGNKLLNMENKYKSRPCENEKFNIAMTEKEILLIMSFFNAVGEIELDKLFHLGFTRVLTCLI